MLATNHMVSMNVSATMNHPSTKKSLIHCSFFHNGLIWVDKIWQYLLVY